MLDWERVVLALIEGSQVGAIIWLVKQRRLDHRSMAEGLASAQTRTDTLYNKAMERYNAVITGLKFK